MGNIRVRVITSSITCECGLRAVRRGYIRIPNVDVYRCVYKLREGRRRSTGKFPSYLREQGASRDLHYTNNLRILKVSLHVFFVKDRCSCSYVFIVMELGRNYGFNSGTQIQTFSLLQIAQRAKYGWINNYLNLAQIFLTLFSFITIKSSGKQTTSRHYMTH